jgi:hypothetical protein
VGLHEEELERVAGVVESFVVAGEVARAIGACFMSNDAGVTRWERSQVEPPSVEMRIQ